MVERFRLEVCCAGGRTYKIKVIPRHGYGPLQGFGCFIQRVLRGGCVDEIVEQFDNVAGKYYEFKLDYAIGVRENLGTKGIRRLEASLKS